MIAGNRVHSRGQDNRRRAVTMLEMVLALGLLSLVSGLTYWFYGSSLETNRKGTAEAQKLRVARVALERIATEIRQSKIPLRSVLMKKWLTSQRSHPRTNNRLD